MFMEVWDYCCLVCFAHLFSQVMQAFVVLCLCDGTALQEHRQHRLLLQKKLVVLFLMRKAGPLWIR